MLTPKQNFLETIRRDGRPDCLPVCFEAFRSIGGDPVFRFVRGNRIRGTDSYDRWGTFISFPETQPAAVPIVTPENQVIQDIERWQDYVRVPDLRANCSDGWETSLQNKAAISSDCFSMTVMGTGIFEHLHMLMTFEDTLMNFLAYPEEMHEIIALITDYRLEYMKLIVEHLHPDVVMSHDDWGSERALFMHPDTWRAVFQEPYRRLYDYLHSENVMVMHHADSFCEPLVEDMVDIGIDVWQGVLPTNDIPRLTGELDGRMALMGGIGSVIDRADAGEAEIRAEVRRALDAYGDLKHFIPCYTYGGPGTIFPHVMPLIHDEIRRYNRERFGVE